MNLAAVLVALAVAVPAPQTQTVALPSGNGVLIYEGHEPDVEHYDDLISLVYARWKLEVPRVRLHIVGYARFENRLVSITRKYRAGWDPRKPGSITFAFIEPECLDDPERVELWTWHGAADDESIIHELHHWILSRLTDRGQGNHEEVVRIYTTAFMVSEDYKNFVREGGN